MESKYAVLILGAGLGGTAVLEMLSHECLIRLVGIVDIDPDAIGLKLAKELDVPVFTDAATALEQSAPCMVFNLTGNDTLSDLAVRQVGANNVVGGDLANVFWGMISRLQQAQNSLLENKARLRAVIQHVREGIISINPQGIIESANPALEKLFGYSAEEMLGNNISMLMPEPNRSMHDGYLQRYQQTGIQHVIGHYREVEALHKNGQPFPIELNVAEMNLEGHQYFVGLIRDISERKEAEEKLTHLALHDPLTGLPNRTQFYDRLEFILSQAQRLKSMAAVLFIDLDGFKAVNDAIGHDMGDQVLRDVSHRLNLCIRKSDVVARLGGDEFTVILNNLQNSQLVAPLAEKIIAVINQPVERNGRSCNVGASIGIAMYPGDAENIDDLIRAADKAMYQAKQDGKNTYRFAAGGSPTG